jgi:uncharacterized protein YerC
MTNVSKKSLKKSVKDKISKQFSGLIADINKSDKSSLFINEFFTESEEIMLTKRLAVIFMLLEEFSPTSIISLLKVSPSTVNKISVTLDRGGHSSIKTYLGNKKNKVKFQYNLEVILRAGMPPMGRGRWKDVFEWIDKTRPNKK